MTTKEPKVKKASTAKPKATAAKKVPTIKKTPTPRKPKAPKVVFVEAAVDTVKETQVPVTEPAATTEEPVAAPKTITVKELFSRIFKRSK